MPRFSWRMPSFLLATSLCLPALFVQPVGAVDEDVDGISLDIEGLAPLSMDHPEVVTRKPSPVPKVVTAPDAPEPLTGEVELLDQIEQARIEGDNETAAALQAQIDALYGILPSPALADKVPEAQPARILPTGHPGLQWLDGDVLVSHPDHDHVKPDIAHAPNGDLYVAVHSRNNPRDLVVYRSTNGGGTWSSWAWWVYPENHAVRNPSITYGADSSDQWIFVAYELEDTSTGNSWVVARRMNTQDWTNSTTVSVHSGITQSAAIYPRITSDAAQFATSAYLYLTYALDGIDYFPVYASRSTDRGANWSTPVNVTGGAENSSWETRPDIAYHFSSTSGSEVHIAFEKLGVSADAAPLAVDESMSDEESETGAESAVSEGGLFTPSNASVQADAGPTVVRSRAVEVSLGNLGSLRNPARSVELNLFGDTNFIAKQERVETNVLGSYAWVGKLDGVDRGQAVLSVTNGILAGSVSMPGAMYHIRHTADGVYIVEQLDHSAFPPELEPIEAPVAPESDGDVSGDDPCTEIKVLVAYTPEARSVDGGTANIESRIALAITETNQSYVNSGMTQRVVLAGTIETTAGDAANSFGTDLGRLQNTGDGYFDNVDSERESVYADMVSLVIENAASCTAPSAYRVLGTKLETRFSSNVRNNFGFLNRADERGVGKPDKLFHQNGTKVFKEVIPIASGLIKSHLEEFDIPVDKPKRFWLHQANINMNNYVAEKVLGRRATLEEAPLVLDEYGNTASAGSIIAFHKYKDDLKAGDIGVICSFGAGYSAGSVVVQKAF